jgi:tetratricopeptide (TPR) repeat protein
MNNLGLLLEAQHHYDQAEQLYRRTYESEQRVLGPDHPQTLIGMNNLLRVLNIQEKVSEIAPLMAARLARLRRQAEQPEATPLALHAYAWELLHCQSVELRDPAIALPMAQRAVELDGERDPNFLETLALAYRVSGNLNQAISIQRKAVAQARLSGSFNRAELEAKLVDYLLEQGDVVGAAAVSWEGLATQLGESLIPGTNPGASLVAQSESLMKERRFGEAAALLRGCLAMRQKVLPEGHWLLADTTSRIGAALSGEGRFVQAESALLEAYQSMQNDRRVPGDTKRQTIERLIWLYDSWEKPDQVAVWRRRLADGPPNPIDSP